MSFIQHNEFSKHCTNYLHKEGHNQYYILSYLQVQAEQQINVLKTDILKTNIWIAAKAKNCSEMI